MTNKPDVHHVNARLQAAVSKIEADVSQPNREHILRFKDYLAAQGVSVGRTLKYLQNLRKITVWMSKDFRKATKADIQTVVGHIEASEYQAWTKHDYKVILKRFWKWLKRIEDGYPSEVRWISIRIKKANQKVPEELLTEEDVRELLETARHPRDRALVSVLYESGCRIGEALALKIKHLAFDQYGALVLLQGKTGMRRVRLIQSVPHISLWLAQHPSKDGDAYLWVSVGTTNNGQLVDYATLRKRLKVLAEAAGIKKRTHPHIFRHSRATHMANKLTDAQMKEYFGWVQGSDMASVYVHLSGRDVDDAILKLHGIKKADAQEEKSPLQPIKCPRCGFTNPPEFKFCGRCSMVLDVQEALKLQSLEETVAKVLGRMLKSQERGGIVDNGTKRG